MKCVQCFTLAVLATAIVMLGSAADAMQPGPGAGAKARGDYSFPYRGARRAYSYAPATPSVATTTQAPVAAKADHADAQKSASTAKQPCPPVAKTPAPEAKPEAQAQAPAQQPRRVYSYQPATSTGTSGYYYAPRGRTPSWDRADSKAKGRFNY